MLAGRRARRPDPDSRNLVDRSEAEPQATGHELDVDPEGWIRLSNVYGISANGRFVVGSGTRRSDGKTGSAAFLIDLGERPGTWSGNQRGLSAKKEESPA